MIACASCFFWREIDDDVVVVVVVVVDVTSPKLDKIRIGHLGVPDRSFS